MYLQRLTLEHFRNHERFELVFEPQHHITYLIGENARGKTNVLEAIYLLALTKSFRTSKDQHLIEWGQTYARVKGSLVLEGSIARQFASKSVSAQEQPKPLQLEIFLGHPPQPLKVLKRNEVKVSSANFIGHCQVVFFHPEDLNLLYLGPELRRRYLDILNLQVNSDYYRALRAYRRILTQRNALLRVLKEGGSLARQTHRDDLEIWDDQLIEQGSLLILERFKTVQFLQKNLQDYYQKISTGREEVALHYRCNLMSEEKKRTEHTEHFFEQANRSELKNSLKNLFKERLTQQHERDIQAHITTIGPHRDDLEFLLNGRLLDQHASRGEYRSLLLSLKLLELQFLEDRSGEKPILLLDDVFSELDLNRQKMLLEAIETHQTIITATHYHEDRFRPGQIVSL